MANTLEEPEAYCHQMDALRARNRYAKAWTMRLEKKTNRHKETSGGLWGWYEIFPLEIPVGYWGSQGDDLKGVDIDAWNKKAERI